MLACLFLLPVGFEHTECWPFLCPDSWKLTHIKLRSWLHQRADRMAELYHTDAHSCEQNQKKPSQTDFRKHWFWHHQFNALWFVDTHCFWSPVGKFLILSALHNEKLWLLWAQFSFFFTERWNPSSFTDHLHTCVHIRKDTEAAVGWIIYLFIHYKCFFDLANCGVLGEPFCHSCYLLSYRGVAEDLKVIWKAAFCSLTTLSILACSFVLQSHHY